MSQLVVVKTLNCSFFYIFTTSFKLSARIDGFQIPVIFSFGELDFCVITENVNYFRKRTSWQHEIIIF